MTRSGFYETSSCEQLGRIGYEALGEATGSVEERCRTARVDVVLFGYALGNGASSDDRDGVVGRADINKAY